MHGFRAISLTLIILLTALAPLPVHAETELVFVVNRSNPVNVLSPDEIKDYFLKKKIHWPGGMLVRFIDRQEGSELRNTFLDTIVGKTSRDVALYWIGQKLYSGDSAPIKVSSDRLVLSFVSKFKGAIGYVSGDAAINSSLVKTITVSGEQ